MWKLIVGLVVLGAAIGGVFFVLSASRIPFTAKGRQLLMDASVGTLYSLEPAPYREKFNDATRPKRERLGEFEILGATEVRGGELAIVRDEFLSVACERSANYKPTACGFEPRHGLRIDDGEHTYDYLICFQCGESALMIDGQRAWFGAARGRPEKLNELLKRLGLPLSTTVFRK